MRKVGLKSISKLPIVNNYSKIKIDKFGETLLGKCVIQVIQAFKFAVIIGLHSPFDLS